MKTSPDPGVAQSGRGTIASPTEGLSAAGDGEIFIIMARTGGSYEYTDWPIEWRWTEAAAEARVAELTELIKALAATVPPCPEIGDADGRWDDYMAKEAAARIKAEDLGAGLDAAFFTVRLSGQSSGGRAPQ